METATGDALWTIYGLMAPVIAAALTWLSARVAGLIKAKTTNEVAAGMLIRLNESVFDAVRAVNQTMAEHIGRARRAESPGGVRITSAEAMRLKQAAVDHVKSYWGSKGFVELARVLGIHCGDDYKSEKALERVVATKIEAAVGEEKKSGDWT